MKLSLEEKKEIVRLYYDDGFGYVKISEKYNVTYSIIRKIIRGYKIQGNDYLIHPLKNNKYSADFKMMIIN